MVLSPLPLAIVPSKPHATENTLRLRCDESAQEGNSVKGKTTKLEKRGKKKKNLTDLSGPSTKKKEFLKKIGIGLEKRNLTSVSAPSTVTQFACPFLRPKCESKSPRFPLRPPGIPHH